MYDGIDIKTLINNTNKENAIETLKILLKEYENRIIKSLLILQHLVELDKSKEAYDMFYIFIDEFVGDLQTDILQILYNYF